MRCTLKFPVIKHKKYKCKNKKINASCICLITVSMNTSFSLLPWLWNSFLCVCCSLRLCMSPLEKSYAIGPSVWNVLQQPSPPPSLSVSTFCSACWTYVLPLVVTLSFTLKQNSYSVDKKNQLDVTFCILYFSSNSCSTCFGQPCAHHQELTTA